MLAVPPFVTASVGGRSLSYDFGDATGCPTNNAGRNTNRRAVTDNGAATTYCYDAADRLVSSSDPAVGTRPTTPTANHHPGLLQCFVGVPTSR